MLDLRLLAAAALVTSAAACGRTGERGPMREVERTAALGDATAAAVRIEFAGGLFELGPAAAPAAEGAPAELLHLSARFDVAETEPVLESAEAAARARVRIHQPAYTSRIGPSANEWVVRLAPGLPLELDLSLGTGVARLALAELDLAGLTVVQGQGELLVDLTGRTFTRSFAGKVEIGTGQSIIRVPRDVGVTVHARRAVGRVTVTGLKDLGKHTYANDLAGTSPVQIELYLMVGMGEVVVEGGG